MHVSASSIKVTALCNVHRFFFGSTQIRYVKIKIVKYSSAIFWPILCDCKVHLLSDNIAVQLISIFHRSLQTNLKNESIKFIAIHPYNLVTATRKKSSSGRKCMVHITNWRWSVQPLHLVVLNRFPRWYYKKLHVISTRKILLKTISTMRFLVTVPRNFSQCSFLSEEAKICIFKVLTKIT